jgi:hypothetical protein
VRMTVPVGTAAAIALVPGDPQRLQVPLLKARRGNGPNGPFLVVLGNADPNHCMAAIPGDHAANLFEECRLVGGVQNCLVAVAQGFQRAVEFLELFLSPLVVAEIVENNRHPPHLRFAHAVGMNVVKAIERLGLIDEMLGLACHGNSPINLEPMFLVIGSEFAHSLAHGIAHAGLLLKGVIHLKESIVLGLALRVKKNFNDAKALVH